MNISEPFIRRPVATTLLTNHTFQQAKRALTVTRALIDEGLPSASIFAAAFGPEQPVASNADAAGRSQNRRVEMAPVPRSANGAAKPRE